MQSIGINWPEAKASGNASSGMVPPGRSTCKRVSRSHFNAAARRTLKTLVKSAWAEKYRDKRGFFFFRKTSRICSNTARSTAALKESRLSK